MGKCSICGTVNGNYEKLCIFCGAEIIAKENKPVLALLRFLSLSRDVNIYIPTTEGVFDKKEKTRPVKRLLLAAKIIFLIMLVLILSWGIISAAAGKGPGSLALETKFGRVIDNIAEPAGSKPGPISEQYDKIRSGIGENIDNIGAGFSELLRTKTEGYNGGLSGFGDSWQAKTEQYGENISAWGETFGGKWVFWTKFWGHVWEIPGKVSYYFNKATTNIKQIFGG